MKKMFAVLAFLVMGAFLFAAPPVGVSHGSAVIQITGYIHYYFTVYSDWAITKDLNLSSAMEGGGTKVDGIGFSTNYTGQWRAYLKSINGGYMVNGANKLPYKVQFGSSDWKTVPLLEDTSVSFSYIGAVENKVVELNVSYLPDSFLPEGVYTDYITVSVYAD